MKLQIKNAIVQYGADVILDHADFEIHDTEKIGVVGRNGCGKTTLFKLITGDLVMSNPSSDESARFIISGGTSIGILRQISFEDGSITVENEIKKVFAEIFECQDRLKEVEKQLETEKNPEKHTALLSKYDNLQKRFDALDGFSWEREMKVMFQNFGFSLDDLERPIGEFSGGQQTKIAFMKLLLSKPDVLLLDEPTNHLDLPTIEWLEGYLKNYKSAVVIISHDRAFLDGIVSVVYEIEYGHITRYSGNYSSFVVQKEANFEKQEKDYEAQQKEIKRLQEWVDKWKNTPTKVATAHSKQKAIEHMVKIERPRRFDTKSFKAMFDPRIESYSSVLNVKDLSVGYDHELSRVTFELRKKERLAVIGENGKGKSTLLKILVGLVNPLGGEFEFGKNVEWGYFDQQQAVLNDEDPEQSVLDNFWDEYPKLKREEVQNALGAFVFTQDEVEKKLGQLSGGERVRLALCKMFYTRPNLLILDEPTNHMDMLGRESLEQMLKNFEGTVLFVSHDRYFIKQIATNILEFGENETKFYDMPYDEYISRKEIEKAPETEQFKNTNQVEKKPAAENTKEKLLASNPGKLASKVQKKLEKLEQSLAESEEKGKEIKKKLSDPELAADYQKLLELQSELEKEEEIQEELLEQIMENEAELEEIEKNRK